MNDLGGEKERLSISESIQVFFERLFAEILKAGKGIIPADLDKALKQSFKDVVGTLGDVPGILMEEGGKVTDQLEKGAETLQDNVEGAVTGIKGLFTKDKK